MKTWLVGNAGMLGREVERLLAESGEDYLATDRDLDCTDRDAVRAFAGEHRPDAIINCAAYTAVDKAEDEPGPAERLNALGPEILAAAAREIDALLVHVSTDYVFSGTAEGPYETDHQTSPLSVYGRTKEAGEIRVASSGARYAICRTAWLFGAGGSNFVSTMLRLFRERSQITVVNDQHGRPTYAPDLAAALLALSRAGASGIYHFCNAGETTWFDFAEEILQRATEAGMVSPTCRIVPVGSDDYPTRAHRPKNSVLSTQRIERELGIVPRPWREALDAYLREVRD